MKSWLIFGLKEFAAKLWLKFPIKVTVISAIASAVHHELHKM